MEQLTPRLPSQNMSGYNISYYLTNEDETAGGGIGGSADKKNATLARIPEPQQQQVNKATITADILDVFLYGKRKIQEIDIEEAKRAKSAKEYFNKRSEKGSIWCDKCQRHRNHDTATCPEPCKVLRQWVGNTVHDIKLTYAVLSFPPEVQLCTSTIPGYGYGVCAKQAFPVGTWIGPYEGTRLQPEDEAMRGDSSYIWEIYEDGNFSHFLDGNDESTSSWMRFIRCARHQGEQNMVVFQYANNIYYRAVRDIPIGNELLVWYNNNYTQFLGVPLGLPTVPGAKKTGQIPPSTQLKDASSPLDKDEFKAFLNEQINKSNSKTGMSITDQPAPNITMSSPGLTTEPPNDVMPAQLPHVIPGGPTNIRPHGIPGQGYPRTPRIIPGTVHIPAPGLPPPGVKGAVVYTVPRSTGTMLPSTTTYCYGMDPRQHPTMTYIKQEAPPVAYHPMVTQAIHTPSTTNQDNDVARQQYPPPPPHSANSTTTTHYSMLATTTQPPTTASSITSPPAAHLNRGDPSVSMTCNQCQQTFSKLSLLQMHMCYKSPDKPFECGHCSQAFATPAELRSHVTLHTNERPFKCGFCGSSFSGAATLNNHMQIHNVERSFRCQKCGQTFSMATQLSRHMRTPGECTPIGAIAGQHQSDEVTTTPYTSTLTRG